MHFFIFFYFSILLTLRAMFVPINVTDVKQTAKVPIEGAVLFKLFTTQFSVKTHPLFYTNYAIYKHKT
jgi:hypothetical protein